MNKNNNKIKIFEEKKLELHKMKLRKSGIFRGAEYFSN